MTDEMLNLEVNTQLEAMWKEHREHVRRMLISLTRDIDLADDLLQDTYIRAMFGIDSYRGGDSKAWLTMIARNVFLMQLGVNTRPPKALSTTLLNPDAPIPSEPPTMLQ